MKTNLEDNLREILIWKTAIQSDLRRITSLVQASLKYLENDMRRRRQIYEDNTEEKINEL